MAEKTCASSPGTEATATTILNIDPPNHASCASQCIEESNSHTGSVLDPDSGDCSCYVDCNLTVDVSGGPPMTLLNLFGINVDDEGLSNIFFVNWQLPRFQPLMFTEALGRRGSRKQTGYIVCWPRE